MSDAATATVTENDDGDWVRTAIVIPEKGQSFALVDEVGERLALINAFVFFGTDGSVNHLIVDVIDKDERFLRKFALAFKNGQREFFNADEGNLISVDFRKDA